MLNFGSVKVLLIVIIVFKRYPSTYCLMQGRCFYCSDLKFGKYLPQNCSPLKPPIVRSKQIFNVIVFHCN